MSKEPRKRRSELMGSVCHTPISSKVKRETKRSVLNADQGQLGEIIASRLYTTREVAAFLGISPKTAENWRWKGSIGPRFIKLSRLVRYPGHEVIAWLNSRLSSSTSNSEGGDNEQEI